MDDLLALTERAQATHFWFQGFRRFVAPAIAEVAARRTNLRILDCGCGTGHNLPLMQPYGEVYGFDLTAGGLALAKSRGRPLVRADAALAPFASDTFDLATSFDVLQCIDADRAAVREMARVVKPGGAVVFTAAALEALRGDHSEAWQEARRYTRGSARALAEQAGLQVERVAYMFGTLVPLMFVTRMVQRVLRPLRGPRTDSDIAVPAAPVNALLAAVVKAEAALSPRLPFPWGSSVLVIARKPRT